MSGRRRAQIFIGFLRGRRCQIDVFLARGGGNLSYFLGEKVALVPEAEVQVRLLGKASDFSLAARWAGL